MELPKEKLKKIVPVEKLKPIVKDEQEFPEEDYWISEETKKSKNIPNVDADFF